MKLGFLSAILEEWSFEEMIDTGSEMGFKCVEVACWPRAKAERRYAGVSHIDTAGLTMEKAAEILEYCKARNIEISALAYYPNVMDADEEKSRANKEHLYKVIDASAMLGVNLVTTFIGRNQNLTVEDNLDLAEKIWKPIVKYAEEKKVRIAIENCPMLFGPDQWPGGQNLMSTPEIWRKFFERIPSENLGLNYDPSHFVWQMMDYVQPVKEFKDKIFHVHFKDIKVDKDRLNQVGIMAYPLDYMSPKLPGLGDVNWSKFVSALTDIGYEGNACIEVEDRAFEANRERILDSLRLSKKYMEQFVI